MAEPNAPALPKPVDPFPMFVRLTQLTAQADRLRLAREHAQSAGEALRLREQETESKQAAREARLQLQAQVGALSQDKYRFDIWKASIQQYNDAVSALDKDAAAQVEFEKWRSSDVGRKAALSRTGEVDAARAADNLNAYLGQFGPYAQAAVDKVASGLQGAAFDPDNAQHVSAFSSALERVLAHDKAMYVAYGQRLKFGQAHLPELLAYGLDYTPAKKQALVDARRAQTNVNTQPDVAAGIHAPIPLRSRSEAAIRAAEYLENAPANFQKAMQSAGVQGAGSPLAGGTPGGQAGQAQITTQPQAQDQSPLRSLLKRALEHPGEVEPRQSEIYAKEVLAGAPVISYREPDGSLTATNVPWAISGEQKPEYFKRLRGTSVGRELLEKPRPLAAAVTQAGVAANVQPQGPAVTQAGVAANVQPQGPAVTLDDVYPPSVDSPGGPLGRQPGAPPYARDASFQPVVPWVPMQATWDVPVPAVAPTPAPGAPAPTTAPKPLATATVDAVAETAANQAIADAQQAAGPLYSARVNLASDDQIREAAKKHQSRYAPNVDPDAWATLILQKSRASVSAPAR